MLLAILAVLAAYLVGSIPSGLIVSKVGFGKDIREYGSGNVGATNAYRILGPVAGAIVFVVDFLKGFLAVGIASYLFPMTPTLIQHTRNVSPLHSSIVVMAAMAAICGHNWSVYLKFSGGKGIATGAGVILMLVPIAVPILLAIWIGVAFVTRYVSVASIVIALIFPFLTLVLYTHNLPYIIFSFAAAFAVIYKHRSNISRLLAGKESKIGERVRHQGGAK